MGTARYNIKKGYALEYSISKTLRSCNSKTAVQGIHSHNTDGFFEIIFFVRGDSSFLIEGTTHSLEPNDIMFTIPDEIHGVIHHSSCEYERHILRITKDFFIINSLENLYNKLNEKPFGEGSFISHETIDNALLHEQLVHIKDESCTEGDKTKYVINILSLLAKRVVRVFDKKIPNPIIKQILLYINDNSCNDISLDTISRDFFINKTYLAKIFKEYTNTTVNQYIIVERLDKARQYCIYSGMSHKDAAKVVGFKDYSTYYRIYKKRYGIAPGEDEMDPLYI